ncbi:MAG: hypothetical protein ACM3ST_08015 [Bdellovibrio bacteriovorus]
MPASAEPPADPEARLEPASESTQSRAPEAPPGQGLAVLAESLYLANLLVLPGIAFLALGWLFFRCDRNTPELAQAHIHQAFSASLWAGVLLVLVNLLIILFGGYRGAHTWVIVILYFTFVHSTLVILGMVGLAKAMSGQCWRMPLIGGRLVCRCPVKSKAGPTNG